MYLHTLLDNCAKKGKRSFSEWSPLMVRAATKKQFGSPSKGFIKASDAIVAEAPAIAVFP
jgi:hypothetical protein